MVCKFDASQCIAVLSPSQSCEAAAKAQAETLVGKGSEKRKLRCKGTERWLKSSGVVTLPVLPVRVVCLAWLKRRASQILKAMEEMGHPPKWRGKCIRACESFCRRPCSPEVMEERVLYPRATGVPDGMVGVEAPTLVHQFRGQGPGDKQGPERLLHHGPALAHPWLTEAYRESGTFPPIQDQQTLSPCPPRTNKARQM